MRASTIALLAAVAAAVGVGAILLADFDESAGPEDGVTLNDVVEDPRAYAGRSVTISGEIAENDFFSLADADLALVIGDDAGKRLLVLPQPGADLPIGLAETTVLRFTGTVRLADSGPEDDGGVLDEGGLLSETSADALLEATQIELVAAENASTPPLPRQLTVSQLLDDPRAYDNRPVLVPGTIQRIGQAGFVLAGQERQIFVGAPHANLDDLRPGDQVRVRAELERLSRFRANSIPEALAGTPELDDRGDTPAQGAPTGEGDPFLVLRALRAPATPATD